MNIDISICTILRGQSHTREKSIAYEFFINDTISYQEAFIPTKTQQIGNFVRAELLAIRKALDVCAKEINCAAKINLLIQQKDTFSLIDRIDTDEMSILALHDMRQLRGIKEKHRYLHSIGCEINYINKECKESTNELAEYRLNDNVKDDVIVNNIKSTLEDENFKSFKVNISRMDTSREELSEVAITDNISFDDILDEPKLKVCNVKKIDSLTTNNQERTNISNEHIYKITNEIQKILNEELKLNEAIAEAKQKLSYLKAYNRSIKDLNLTISDENNKLELDINKLKHDIAIVSTEVDTKKSDVNKSSEYINILSREVNSIQREISNIKEKDILLIKYLKHQIERLVLEANLPFLR